MRRILALIILVLVGIVLLVQQGYLLQTQVRSQTTAPVFVNVSRTAGIVNNRVVSLDMAAGQAWGDYDNDGWSDLYVTDPAGPNTLYRNNGDGTFSVSPLNNQVRLAAVYSGGATWADFDNDGWRDLFIANWGADTLFHNDSGQGFSDVTIQSGIKDNGNSKTASWGDFDNDGNLDLYIANWSCYPQCGREMDGQSDRLYRNNGDGTFIDVSGYLGGSLNGAGFVASFVDYDNDGDPDIYLVNDEFINPVGNKLWRNDGPGCQGWCFKEISKQAGANARLMGMGLAVGDYDNDGNQDFYFSNVGPTRLLHNNGDGTFTDVAEKAGVQTPTSISWGAVFFDYNNDGWRDIYLAVSDTTDHKDVAANKLFRNNADGTFTAVACNNEANDIRPTLGVAYADYDKDGWVDLVIGNMDEGYRLYRNQAGASEDNHWLALELVGGGRVNRDAVGARVHLTTPDGVTQTQDVINGSSMGSGNELTLYFGIGQFKTADAQIRWPDGTMQSFKNVAANHHYQLTYSAAGTSQLQTETKQAVSSPSPFTNIQLTPAMMLALTGLALALIGILFMHTSPRAGWALFGASALALLAGFISPAMPATLSFNTDAQLAALMAKADVRPPTNPAKPTPELVKLGEALFWDPELSGNRDISCATCHHPDKATGDNLSVSIGTRAVGLGEKRIRLEQRRDLIPRNAPPVFNLGYVEWKVLFWDGRVSGDLATGFETPASDRLPKGLDNLLAAQGMFPVTSRDEMRGLRGDKDIFGNTNELANLVDYAARPIWMALMNRLLAIPGYVDLFHAAYPDIPTEELGFQHAANALSAYQEQVFTFEDAPFDRYIRGDLSALTPEQKRGGILFYGKAQCGACHSTGLTTDQKFHNLAVPQIGDGKGREQPFDLGRARETGNACDRYAFRTAPLRNVAITGPWMHDGAFTTLEATARHHLNPAEGLKNYDPAQLTELMQDTCLDDDETIAAILATKSQFKTEQVELSDAEMKDLLAFLDAFTSPSALDLSHTIPASVPSGLPVGGEIQDELSTLSGQ